VVEKNSTLYSVNFNSKILKQFISQEREGVHLNLVHSFVADNFSKAVY
jgi:hypothetical protein